jgi:hypothetical protein
MAMQIIITKMSVLSIFSFSIPEKMAKPEDITDINSWLYNHKKKNVLLGADGSMLVLDPKTLDSSKPLKTIPFRKGLDAFRVMTLSTEHELRAAATEKLAEQKAERQEHVDAAYAKVIEADQLYLQAVDSWEADKTALGARAVAEAQQILSKAEEVYRRAMYPHRSIHMLTLARREVDYKTKDDRMLPFEVALETYGTTTSVERILPIVADKA